MKKQSYFTWIQKYNVNEAGFFLPYVLFITSLVFMIVTTSINIYQQDTQMTHRYVDQLRIETLVQMGLATFRKEYLPNESSTLTVDYVFPDGEVTIVYHLIDEFEYRLHFTVLTVNDSLYTVLHTVKLPTLPVGEQNSL